MINEVIKKLDKESKDVKGNHEGVMAPDTKKAIITFCRQSEEFCRAVLDGGTFADCMKAVARNCGQSLSDFEAFSRAVKFYFPTATIHFEMHINTEGNNDLSDAPAEETSSALTMSLDDLLGM